MGCASLEFIMTVSDTGMSAKPRQLERTNLFLGINFNKKIKFSASQKYFILMSHGVLYLCQPIILKTQISEGNWIL